ncbi:MAG: helix-turn-helix transcriptional regulator [Chlorobiaceae bacterium]
MTDKASGSKALDLMARELKNVRIKRELSLEDVSQLVKIHKNYLEKIEDGDFSFLPRVYIFTYIKEYAQEMEIRNDEALEQCRKELQVYSSVQSSLSADVGSTPSAVKSAVAENVKGIRLPPVRTMVKIGVALLVLALLVLLYFFKK